MLVLLGSWVFRVLLGRVLRLDRVSCMGVLLDCCRVMIGCLFSGMGFVVWVRGSFR